MLLRYGIIILFFFGFSHNNLEAQEKIHWTSEVEKEVFEALETGKSFDTLALLMVISETDTANINAVRRELDSFHNSLLKVKHLRKNKTAYVKRMRKEFQFRIFKDFDEKSDFANMMYTGRFNHFSAATVYAYMFQKNGIPFNLKEYPSYVYVEALIGKKTYKVDESAEDAHYYKFNDEQRVHFVKSLYAKGVISKDDFENLSTEYLEQKYGFKHGNISMRELVGAMYAYEAIFLMNNGFLENAMHMMNKAYMLYPGERIKFMKYMCIANFRFRIENHTGNDWAYVLLNLSECADFFRIQELTYPYHQLMQVELLRNKRFDFCTNIHNAVLKNLAGYPKIQEEIARLYFFYLAKYYEDVPNVQLELASAFEAFDGAEGESQYRDELLYHINKSILGFGTPASNLYDWIAAHDGPGLDSLLSQRGEMVLHNLIFRERHFIDFFHKMDKTKFESGQVVSMKAEFNLFAFFVAKSTLSQVDRLRVIEVCEEFAAIFIATKEKVLEEECQQLAKKLEGGLTGGRRINSD